MNMNKILVLFVICLNITSNVFAQEYPVKPVMVIIPFSEGSATDIIAREVSKKLSEIWDQTVECKNLPGEGGTIAARAVAHELPDGYTIFVHSSAFAINPSINSNLLYDPLKDFTAVTPIVKQPLALVVDPSSGINSLSGLIALVKSKQNKLKFGSPGTGSAAHLTAEKFKLFVGLDMEHVPFKGGPETVSAINKGTVIFSFLPVAFAKKSIEQGKLKALGVTSIHRSSVMPNVPTIVEEGINGFEYNHWWGIWTPAGISPSISKKIEKDVAIALKTPELRDLFKEIGADPMEMSSEEFSKFVHSEIESMKIIVQEARIMSN